MYRSPGEVYEVLKKENYCVPMDIACCRREEYVKEQEVMNKAYAEFLTTRQEVLPPCAKCNPMVFCYCADKEIECKKFDVYTGSGKINTAR